ncbi:hypothetical protein HYZ41_00145 [archaeon]|nr:hypothetical protein [archaeon]
MINKKKHLRESYHLPDDSSSCSIRHKTYTATQMPSSKSSNKKGQMFLIGAILMIMGTLLVFNVVGVKSITEESRHQEGKLLNRQMNNIMNEYKYGMGVAAIQQNSNKTESDYAATMSSFLRNDAGSRIFYTIAYVNGTTQAYSVNVGNYLSRKINVTVAATDSSPSSAYVYLGDRQNSTMHFSSLISNGMINLTLSYMKGSSDVQEKFSLNVSDKKYMTGFFDVTLIDSGSLMNSKEIHNITW